MTVESQRLRSLLVLAEERHFGRAAARLGISQPSLSQQIARLEREVGVGLVDRGPRGTRLTAAGDRLIAAAAPALAAIDDAVATIRGGEPVTVLRLAVPRVEYARHPVVAATLGRARRSLGGGAIVLREMLPAEALAALRGREVDAAYLYAPVDDDTVEVHPAFADTLVIAMAADHPFAERERLVITDLADETIVIWERRTMPEQHDALLAGFRRAGIEPRIAEAPNTPGVGERRGARARPGVQAARPAADPADVRAGVASGHAGARGGRAGGRGPPRLSGPVPNARGVVSPAPATSATRTCAARPPAGARPG